MAGLGFKERLLEMLGGRGSIAEDVLNIGSGMLGAGASLNVMSYGVTATAKALNNLQPANTASLGQGQSKGIDI